MKKIAMIVLLVIALGGIATAATIVITSSTTFNKYITSKTTKAVNAGAVTGEISVTPSVAGCAVFMNATTLARTQATTGFVMENATHTLIVKDRTFLTFTCATTASVEKAIYTAR